MKYIKTFEDQNNNNTTLKKYVMWKMSFVIVILENMNDNKFKRICIYNPDRNRLLDASDSIFPFNEDEIKEHVIYDSDNLDDCLDLNLLESLFNVDKYNL